MSAGRDPASGRRRTRRAPPDRAVRRRRLVAGAALLAGLAAVVAIVVATSGSDGGDHGASRAATGDGAGHRTARGDGAAHRTRVPAGKRGVAVPILMYHLVADPPPDSQGLPELYVAKADFAGQMRWLKAQGYSAVTEQQVYDLWRRGVALPRRPVVISFDDGYRSVGANALPIMRRAGMRGVLNLEIAELSQPDQGGITPTQVRALLAAGWELNSHTMTHPDLTTLDDATLRAELVGPRRVIRRRFGRPARFFCYPAGRYDPHVVAAVKAAGYLGATTTNFGNAGPHQLLTMNRVRINRSDGVDGFAGKLTALRGRRAAPAPPSFGGAGGGA